MVAKKQHKMSILELMENKENLIKCALRAELFMAGMRSDYIDIWLDNAFGKAENDYRSFIEPKNKKLWRRLNRKFDVAP